MPNMSIAERRKDYDDQIAFHRGEIKVLWARLRVLHAQCDHPDQYTYYAMGEPGQKCPDCGWQT